jgi:hypothetical protein
MFENVVPTLDGGLSVIDPILFLNLQCNSLIRFFGTESAEENQDIFHAFPNLSSI